jgi:hypothetical protein
VDERQNLESDKKPPQEPICKPPSKFECQQFLNVFQSFDKELSGPGEENDEWVREVTK